MTTNPDELKRIQNCAARLRDLCKGAGLPHESDQADAIRESALCLEIDYFEQHGPIVDFKK